MHIEVLDEGYHDDVIEIAEKLKVKEDGSGWFLEDAWKRMIPLDIKIQKGYVAVEKEVIGFITYFSEYGKAKIGWIAVDPERHGEGIGRGLLKAVEEDVNKSGSDVLYVETPTKEEGIGNDYEGTYLFYEAMGFTVEEVIEDDNCDMALLIKKL
ncbi:MAG: GNAT family N-acetyltransferase [Thermoplasmata archaeon]